MKDLNEAFKKTLDFFEKPDITDEQGKIVDLRKSIVMQVSENIERVKLKDGREAMVKIIITAEHEDLTGDMSHIGGQQIKLFEPDILAEA